MEHAEEHRVIEDNARRKGANNEQLSAIRRAEEASARDRLRQQKAASIAATPGGRSPGNQSTTSLLPSSLLSPVTAIQTDEGSRLTRSQSSGLSIRSIDSSQA